MPNVFETSFRQHPVHAHLERAVEELGRLSSEPWEAPEGDALEYVEAARVGIEHVRALLEVQDPRLLTPAMLDGLQQPAISVAEHLATFNADRTQQTAEAVVSNVASLLDVSFRFPRQISSDASELLDHARRAAAEYAQEQIARSVAVAQERLAELSGAAAEATSTVEGVASESVTSVTEAAKNASERADTATAALDAARALFDATTQQLEVQRSSAISQINEVLAGMETRFLEATRRREETFRRSFNEGESEFEALLSGLKDTEEEAERILKLAGGSALSARWLPQADRQFAERVVWYRAIAAILLVSIGIAVVGLDGGLTAPAEMSFVQAMIFYAPRLPFAIVTITVLGFAVQQAGRRAQWEARDRRVGNELTALPAFLEHVREEERGKVAQGIADKYFPGPQVAHDAPAADPRSDHPVLGLSAPLVGSLLGNAGLLAALLAALAQ